MKSNAAADGGGALNRGPLTGIRVLDLTAVVLGPVATLVHPTEGEVVTTRPTALFSKTPSSIYKAAPNLGEDTGRVLGR